MNFGQIYLLIGLLIYLVTLITPSIRGQWTKPLMALLSAVLFIILWFPIIAGLVYSDLRKKARKL